MTDISLGQWNISDINTVYFNEHIFTFLATPCSTWDLDPWPGIKLCAPCIGNTGVLTNECYGSPRKYIFSIHWRQFQIYTGWFFMNGAFVVEVCVVLRGVGLYSWYISNRQLSKTVLITMQPATKELDFWKLQLVKGI